MREIKFRAWDKKNKKYLRYKDLSRVFVDCVGALWHCYSMKLYSKRRNKTLEIGIKDES